MGSASTTYVSISDLSATSTAGDQCQGLSLPSLTTSTGQTYQCAASSTNRNANGTGWIPVNFSKITSGSPIGDLPVDPTNQTSSNLYYTYTTNGTQYEVTAILESQKYKTQFGTSYPITDYPEVIAQGSNLTLSELFNPSGIVGYWPLNEGSGTIAYDQSGNGNNGTWNGSTSTNGTYYTGGKVGSYAGNFNGSNDYISIPNAAQTTSAFSASVWANIPGLSFYYIFDKWSYSAGNYRSWSLDITGDSVEWRASSAGTDTSTASVSDYPLPAGWNYIVGTYNGTNIYLYVNGALISSAPLSSVISTTQPVYIGGGDDGTAGRLIGSVDDPRIYNRALSSAEVQALYNAEH
jgi:hypothetical protein